MGSNIKMKRGYCQLTFYYYKICQELKKKHFAISFGKSFFFLHIFTKCLMLQTNIHTDKADYRNINATLLTIRCMGGGAVRPRLRFLTFTQNLQATHSWKFLTFPNFLLEMPLWKKKLSFTPTQSTFGDTQYKNIFFALIKKIFLQTLVEII